MRPAPSCPPLRAIPRRTLTGRIACALEDDAHVVLVAEAGYGKTVALEAAVEALGWRAAWVSCRDPGPLDGRLAAALEHAAGAPAAGLAARLATRGDARDAREAFEELAGRLAGPTVLVVDDAEELTGSGAELVQGLLDARTDRLRVAVAARSPLPLRLGRLRAAGSLSELGPAALALDAGECAALLRERLEREPTTREVERVLEATEGWVLGAALATATGSLGIVKPQLDQTGAFLREEVLDRLDSRLREALLDAGIPERLDEELVAALGLPDGLLDEIAGRGLFLRACDAARRTFRFHPLFREFLLEAGARERPAASRRALHARLAAALAERGEADAAVEHWLAAGDWEAALRATADQGLRLAAVPPSALEALLERLPAEGRARPAGQLLAGLRLWAIGQHEAAAGELSAAVDGHRRAGDAAAEWTALALLADALLALGAFDHVAELAHGLDGPDGWRAGVGAPAAGMAAALAHAAAGRADESRAAAAVALRHPAGGTLTALEHLRHAQLDVPRGRLDGALSRIQGALVAFDRDEPPARRTALLACAAEILVEQGRDDEALRAWERVELAASGGMDAWYATVAGLHRALLQARAGRLAAAEVDITRCADPVPGWRTALRDAAIATVAARQGEAPTVLAAVERALTQLEDAPVAARLSLVADLAPVLGEAGAPARAATLVDEALSTADAALPGEAGGYARARLLVQRAWHARQAGDEARADADVEQAWRQAGPAAAHLVRREWARLEPLLWTALEHGLLEPGPVLRAIELAWPGGAALTPFTEHPIDAVRRGAIGPAVASGHPRALGQLKGLAKEPDPQLAAAARAALESVRRMPPPLIFRLLGGFEARRGTWRIEPADWGRPMTARLVRFLLVHRDRVVPEDVLFEAFWPGKAAPAARHNLQVAASMARGVLDPGLGGESVIEAVDRGYRLRLADHDLVDAEEFELAARAALAEPRLVARRRLLDRAARLWGGEPLPEDGYMDWSLDWRRQLNELYASVLEALVAVGRDSADMRATIEAGTRLLALDPLNETVHRELMAAYARSGRVGDALRQYLQCRRALVDELGVEPSPATSLMQGQILAGEFA